MSNSFIQVNSMQNCTKHCYRCRISFKVKARHVVTIVTQYMQMYDKLTKLLRPHVHSATTVSRLGCVLSELQSIALLTYWSSPHSSGIFALLTCWNNCQMLWIGSTSAADTAWGHFGLAHCFSQRLSSAYSLRADLMAMLGTSLRWRSWALVMGEICECCSQSCIGVTISSYHWILKSSLHSKTCTIQCTSIIH